jgi:hypothetical protein
MSEVTISSGLRKNSKLYWVSGRAHVKEREYLQQGYIALCCRHKQSLFTCPGRAKIDIATNTATTTFEHTCETHELEERILEVYLC